MFYGEATKSKIMLLIVLTIVISALATILTYINTSETNQTQSEEVDTGGITLSIQQPVRQEGGVVLSVRRADNG